MGDKLQQWCVHHQRKGRCNAECSFLNAIHTRCCHQMNESRRIFGNTSVRTYMKWPSIYTRLIRQTACTFTTGRRVVAKAPSAIASKPLVPGYLIGDVCTCAHLHAPSDWLGTLHAYHYVLEAILPIFAVALSFQENLHTTKVLRTDTARWYVVHTCNLVHLYTSKVLFIFLAQGRCADSLFNFMREPTSLGLFLSPATSTPLRDRTRTGSEDWKTQARPISHEPPTLVAHFKNDVIKLHRPRTTQLWASRCDIDLSISPPAVGSFQPRSCVCQKARERARERNSAKLDSVMADSPPVTRKR